MSAASLRESQYTGIDAALLRGATLLTPTPRAARAVMANFDAARRAAGERTWHPPAVLPWRAWLSETWRNALVAGTETRIPLNDVQERALWEQVLNGDAAETLHSPASVARMCTAASRLLGQYDTEGRFSSNRATAAQPDAAAFARWFAAFAEACSEQSLLPFSHVEAELAASIANKRIPTAREYILYGFGDLTPSQQSVIAALQASGASVTHADTSLPSTTAPRLITCPNPDAELTACANWVRQTLQANPATSIAIVVPNLDACRPELERALRNAVAPQLADITRAGTAPFEFSTGRPLHRLPMVADALRLLRWCIGEIPVEDAGAVLRSPWLSLSDSPSRGAEMDAFLLRDSKHLIAAQSLRGTLSLSAAAGIVDQSSPATADRLRRLHQHAGQWISRADTWARICDEARALLKRAGWPGDSLSSEEFQAVDRWNEALDKVASLDLLSGRVHLPQVVEAIDEVVHDTVFAPENTGAPIQVITVTEAVGITTDALWFLHADAATWPARAAANPLLPWRLQRDLGMPGVDLHRDEERARAAMHRLIASAGETSFSYAATTSDGSHQMPAAMVEALPDLVTIETTLHAGNSTDVTLEAIEERDTLPGLPDATVFGGVSVIQAQAQCGFKAFAERRLFSTAPDAVDAGMSQADRGTQVHAVLEKFWSRMATPDEPAGRRTLVAAMRDISPDGISARDRLLGECIDEVLSSNPDHRWDAAYIQVQRERLMSLLGAWLDAEAKRPPFEVIALEQEIDNVTLGPLRFKLRVDRMDKVTTDDGEGTILIDYKTGKLDAKAWEGERPDEPQLPVYAVAGGVDDVRGIGFALVRVQKDGMKIDGVSDPASLIGTRRKVGFDERMEEWALDLERLAEAFARGEANVNPKEYPKTCDRCDQRMLCRLDPLRLEAEDVDDEEDEEGAWN